MLTVDQLLEEHEGYVVTEALRRGMYVNADLDDLIQEGRLGIVDAAKRFKPQKSIKHPGQMVHFLSYARFNIRYRMNQWCRKNWGCVQVPRDSKARVEFDCIECLESFAYAHDLALPNEMVVDEDSRSHADLALLRACVDRLSKSQRDAVRAVYLEDRLEEEVAESLGVSRQAVHQRLESGFRHLKRMRVVIELWGGKAVSILNNLQPGPATPAAAKGWRPPHKPSLRQSASTAGRRGVSLHGVPI